jgi:hypothetical protein
MDSNTVIVLVGVWAAVSLIFGTGFMLGAALGKSKLEDELAGIMLAEEDLQR